MKHKLCISTQFDMLEVFAQVIGSNFEIQKRRLVYRSSLQRRSFIGVLKT